MRHNKMNHRRPVLKVIDDYRRARNPQERGGICTAASGVCSAERTAPNGETCVGWEEILESGKDTDKYQCLCSGCLTAYERALGHQKLIGGTT